MSDVVVRAAVEGDAAAINAIYNHYVVNTATTFDTEEWTLDRRRTWLTGFGEDRHQLLVADRDGDVIGYCYAGSFRARPAYDTTVETSVYLRPDATGLGLGRRLYEHLFAALADRDVHLAVAGMTLPNDASRRLHERLGFQSCGVMHEVGRKFDRYWDVAWFERPF